jgi:hypothetical protein
MKKIKPIEYADGHGWDANAVLDLALTLELEQQAERMPGDVVVVLSLDAKLFMARHFTHCTLR